MYNKPRAYDMKNHTVFLEHVTGHEIVKKQTEINNTQDERVIATTILPRKEDGYYDAWIYYTKKIELSETLSDIYG